MIERVTDETLDEAWAIECATFEEIDRFSFREIQSCARTRFGGIYLERDEEGNARGSIILSHRPNPRSLRIYSISVDPDFRGQGVARHLMEFAIEETLRVGAERLTLEVREDNLAARTLYESYGFEPFGRYEEFYSDGAPAIRYELHIESAGEED